MNQQKKKDFKLPIYSQRATGKQMISRFDEVAKPPKMDIKPGTVLFVPPGSHKAPNSRTNDSYLICSNGLFWKKDESTNSM